MWVFDNNDSYVFGSCTFIMNIFPIEYGEDGYPCPVKSAQAQCDKHVVKMPTESGQMLSTAHRILDGKLTMRPSVSGKRMVKYWDLFEGRDDLESEMLLYKAVHPKHPSTLWTMESEANYRWHWEHYLTLCQEYTRRYGKFHGAEKVLWALRTPPENIPKGPLTKMPLAMLSNPECMKDDVVESYRLFYQTKQHRFKMTWKNGQVPEWFQFA
jgi:hypothetical protein